MKNAECATSVGKQAVFVHISSTNFCYRAVLDVGLRPLASWDSGFKSHRGHGCVSVCVCVCVCVCVRVNIYIYIYIYIYLVFPLL